MDWKSANKNEDDTFDIPMRWLHIHYFEALNILFRMENALRVFVYIILKIKLMISGLTQCCHWKKSNKLLLKRQKLG